MNQFPTDSFLIKDILDGNKDSFRVLYQRYARTVNLICQRYAKNNSDAEDYLQESFVTVFRKLNQFDPKKGEFPAWLKVVTVNTCLQQLRRKSFGFLMGNLSEVVSLVPTQQPDALENLSLEDLTKRIQKLPIGYRTVFNMYVVDGYSHKEIAESLSITESTSRSQLVKAKKHLQGILKRQNFEVNYG